MKTRDYSRRPSRLQLVAERLFGFDVFLSYARRSSTEYARHLAQALRTGRLSVFLDESPSDGFPAGGNLAAETARAVRASSTLILVFTPDTLESKYVLDEIRRFRQAGKPVIPVDRDGALKELRDMPANREALGDRLEWTPEECSLLDFLCDVIIAAEEPKRGFDTPSEAVVTKLLGSLKITRRSVLRYRIVSSVAVALLALTVAVAVLFVFESSARSLAETRLRENHRLSDPHRLSELTAQADDLWFRDASGVPALSAWLEDAAEIVARAPQHRRELAEVESAAPIADLESRRRIYPDEVARLEAIEASLADARKKLPLLPPGNQTLEKERIQDQERQAQSLRDTSRWVFSSNELQWKHRDLTVFLTKLDAWGDPTYGLIASVQRRLELARTLYQRSDAHEELWRKCASAVAESSVYRGLSIEPQLGLLPLGRDLSSGLFEFLHLASHVGQELRRDPFGALTTRPLDGMVVVLLPGGRFRMGAQAADPSTPNMDPKAQDNESPVHWVDLDPFFLSKYELTKAQWFAMTHEGAHNRGHFDHPVVDVPWSEASAVGKRFGLELPTEAQWECAARAGSETPWSGGRTQRQVEASAELRTSRGAHLMKPRPRGEPITNLSTRGEPNGFGLVHMEGNVRELCRDRFVGYGFAPRAGDGLRDEGLTLNALSGIVVRGGSSSSGADMARCAYRGRAHPTGRAGVRYVRSLDPRAKARAPARSEPVEPKNLLRGLRPETNQQASPEIYALLQDPSVQLIQIPGTSYALGATTPEDQEARISMGIHQPSGYAAVPIQTFLIARTEVTGAQFLRFLEEATSPPEVPGDLRDRCRRLPEHPVRGVTWTEANAYCEWADLSLPTIAEWEYAARGESLDRFPWGMQRPDKQGPMFANTAARDDGFQGSAPVGRFPSGNSPFGCCDMIGNVWELCSDPFGLQGSPGTVVGRGGSFSIGHVQVTGNSVPVARDKRLAEFGFRPVRR